MGRLDNHFIAPLTSNLVNASGPTDNCQNTRVTQLFHLNKGSLVGQMSHRVIKQVNDSVHISVLQLGIVNLMNHEYNM